MGDDSASSEDLTLGRDAFMNHVEGVLDPAYRLATVMLLDHDAAEDAVHDATVRAWRRYRQADGEVISFRTWFLAIVVAQCRTALRWRWLPFGGPQFAAGVDRSDTLQAALGALPLASRTALFCFVSLDLPMDEVARVLGTSLSRVRARVYRAGERVQAQLDRDEEMEA